MEVGRDEVIMPAVREVEREVVVAASVEVESCIIAVFIARTHALDGNAVLIPSQKDCFAVNHPIVGLYIYIRGIYTNTRQ
jgi:hypothetical protein